MLIICLLPGHLVPTVYVNVKQMPLLSYGTSLPPRCSNNKDGVRKKEKGLIMVLDVNQIK